MSVRLPPPPSLHMSRTYVWLRKKAYCWPNSLILNIPFSVSLPTALVCGSPSSYGSSSVFSRWRPSPRPRLSPVWNSTRTWSLKVPLPYQSNPSCLSLILVTTPGATSSILSIPCCMNRTAPVPRQPRVPPLIFLLLFKVKIYTSPVCFNLLNFLWQILNVQYFCIS